MKPSFRFRGAAYGTAAVSGGSLLFAAWYLVFGIRAIDPVYYHLYLASGPLGGVACGAAFAVAGAGGGVALYRKRAAGMLRPPQFPALLPAAIAVLFFPGSFWSVLLAVAGFGVIAFRLGRDRFRQLENLVAVPPERVGGIAVALLFLLGVGWGTYTQIHAHRAMFLIFQDWGEYALGYLKLAFGESRWHDWLMVGGHWNPLPNLVMTALTWLVPAPETLFAASAFAIYLPVPLVYLLARECRLPVGTGLIFSVIAFFNPVLTNQCLVLFYGYHPIVFFMPLLLGFFIFREKKQSAGMIAMFVLSLLVQETVAIFWMGYGVVLIVRRRWKTGAALTVFSGMLFLFLSGVALKHAYADNGYTQLFHYAKLGGNMTEMLLSPLLRPAAFWGALLREVNFLFVLTLFLPFGLLWVRSRVLLLAVIPLLIGICLQDSSELQNVVFQYGVETTALLLAVSVLSVAVRPGGGLAQRRWAAGALSAALCCTLLAHYAVGKGVYLGKYSFAPVMAMPDCRALVRHLTDRIEPGSSVRASGRLRAQMMFAFPTVKLSDAAARAEYLALDLTNPTEGFLPEFEALRWRIAADRAYVPITFANYFGREAVLFRKIDPSPNMPLPAERLPFLKPVTAAEFAGLGRELPSENPDFSIRVAGSPDGSAVRFYLKPAKAISYDVNITLSLFCGDQSETRQTAFAHGFIPASVAGPERMFILDIAYPAYWPGINDVAVRFETRRFSEIATGN